MWITRFQAEYLSPDYANVDLQLAPVNVLLGRNNAGKSRLLQALASLAAFEIEPNHMVNSSQVHIVNGQITAGKLASNIKAEFDGKLLRNNSRISPIRYLPVDRTPLPTLDTRNIDIARGIQDLLAQSTGVQDLLVELNDFPLFRPLLQYEIERLFGLSLRFEFQQYNLNVYAEDISSAQKFMLNEHGRGLQYFVALFFYLYHPDVRVLFIDEPENSLHPQLQRALISRVRSIALEQGKQVFLATHSPLFALPETIEDLKGTFLLQRNQAQPKILSLSSLVPTDPEKKRKFESYIPNLDASIAELFFATGAFIVEGQTERQFMQYIATRTGRELPRRGITIIESNGLALMPGTIQLAQPILPHWHAVCDGDLFTDRRKIFDEYRQNLSNVLGIEILLANLEDADTRNKVWARGLYVLPKTGLEEYYISPAIVAFRNGQQKVEPKDKGWLLAEEIECLQSKDADFINATYSDLLTPLDALIAEVDAATYKPHSLDELTQDILFDDANKIHRETYRQQWNEEQLRKSLSQSRSLSAYELQFNSFDSYNLLWKNTVGGYYRIRCAGVWFYIERTLQPDGDYVELRKATVDKE